MALVIETRKGEPGGRELDLLIHKADVAVVPVDAEHVSEARRAYRCFGKGRHAAGLDFGDLIRLRAGQGGRRTAPLQGRGFRANRHQARCLMAESERPALQRVTHRRSARLIGVLGTLGKQLQQTAPSARRIDRLANGTGVGGVARKVTMFQSDAR